MDEWSWLAIAGVAILLVAVLAAAVIGLTKARGRIAVESRALDVNETFARSLDANTAAQERVLQLLESIEARLSSVEKTLDEIP